jgi:cytidine kinase
MADSEGPAYVCVGCIFIDDIVFPSGETRMGVLGGGVSHAAAGMMVWGQRPGLCSSAGHDLPDTARQRLERDFDLRGVAWLTQPQARAWQIFEWDGKRTEIYRVDDVEPYLRGPEVHQTPAVYQGAKAVYLIRTAPSLPSWRALFPRATLFWEPEQQYMVRANATSFRNSLPMVDIVSPNLLEASQVYAITDPASLVRVMLDDGARIVVLRMGEKGSLAGMRGSDTMFKVPAVPVPHIVDQTGAGNTYGGGFLVGWMETGSLSLAACYGAVSASFALEVTGVADPSPDSAALRDQRLHWLRGRIVEFS